MGTYAGRHELLLYGVELEHRKADSRVRPVAYLPLDLKVGAATDTAALIAPSA
jgi:hypothetical protein